MMGKENRGFASASPERRKELSKKGSDKALQSPDRHRFTPAEARMAAEKGLEKRRANILKTALGNREAWEAVEVRQRHYRIHQMGSHFLLREIAYPPGSWLVWEDGEEYALAMSDSQYHLWRIA